MGPQWPDFSFFRTQHDDRFLQVDDQNGDPGMDHGYMDGMTPDSIDHLPAFHFEESCYPASTAG